MPRYVEIVCVSANEPKCEDTYRATIESADKKLTLVHTGTEHDCQRWVRETLRMKEVVEC